MKLLEWRSVISERDNSNLSVSKSCAHPNLFLLFYFVLSFLLSRISRALAALAQGNERAGSRLVVQQETFEIGKGVYTSF